jgi:hypothetical protein
MVHRTHSKRSDQPMGAVTPEADAQANSLIEQEAMPAVIQNRSGCGNPVAASDARHRAWLRQAVRREK